MAGNLITDRVKQLVRMRGPLIPSQISKEIGTNILMASAILSELASKSDVKISSVKVGGTPLYYVPGQEAKLQNYLTSLAQKERDAFEQLKSNGVLSDTNLDPATRFAMRQIKDFAKPLDVSINGEPYLFWKWYLLDNDAAEVKIKKIMGFEEAEEKQPQQQKFEQPALAGTTVIEPVVGTETLTKTPPQQTLNQPVLQSTVQQHTLGSHTQQAEKVKTPPITSTTAATTIAQQQSLVKSARKKAIAPAETEFTRSINDFLGKNSIEVESAANVGRTELEYVVLLPSPVGRLRYYCIAKNKKTCTDTDISSALIKGQLNKLPVLLLIKGEISKKAQELLLMEIGSIVVKRI